MPHHTPFIGTIVADLAVTLVTAANAHRLEIATRSGYKVGYLRLEVEHLVHRGCAIFRRPCSLVTQLGWEA